MKFFKKTKSTYKTSKNFLLETSIISSKIMSSYSVDSLSGGITHRTVSIEEPTIVVKEREDINKYDKFAQKSKIHRFVALRDLLAPIAITIFSFYLRFHDIGAANRVIWDEAHFGKFGAHYIKHDFYHDVHPPLGKMLIGLSLHLAGYKNFDFNFDSGATYPEDVDYVTMRKFNALFGALCAPVAYFTAKSLGFNSIFTSYLFAIMVSSELTYVCLSKFILLDSILLFFTLTTYLCIIKVYTYRKKQLTKKWWLWLLLTGINIGCVCSVKWVGLFVTATVGLYVLWELFLVHCDKKMSWKNYSRHWLVRIINLIIVPFLIYLLCFKIHFALLYKSGKDDGICNSIFQANLEGSQIDVTNTPRNVHYHSMVTIRSYGLSPSLLHSHVQTYPKGSGQHQITGYGHQDTNNDWIVKPPRSELLDDPYGVVTNGSLIRLQHNGLKVNLHSHDIPSHVSKGYREVSGYGNEEIGDEKDDWIVEIVNQMQSADADLVEDSDLLHPISTQFRLKHKALGCYLATTGLKYPHWGYTQNEVVCKESWWARDKSTWWNIEFHTNENVSRPATPYVVPKSNFWDDFVLINFAMASTNNALVPDGDKYDSLASGAWEWPTLHKGLRICGWSINEIKYYLVGSPFQTWLSTVCLLAFSFSILIFLLRWRRQCVAYSVDDFESFLVKGVLPFAGWAFHFLPFVIMARVTYVHHYLPALYFAMLIMCFVVDTIFGRLRAFLKIPLYLMLIGLCLYIYYFFSPLAQGMKGGDYAYLNLLNSWHVV